MGAQTFVHPQVDEFLYWKDIYAHNFDRLQDNITHMFMYMYMLRCFYKTQNNENMGPSSTFEAKCIENARIKYQGLAYMINSMDNDFYNDQHREYAMDLFSHSQKTYHAFAYIARKWKIKHSKVNIDTDLCLNPIDPSSSQSIAIYQTGANYLFKLSDLINIINGALLHSPFFFTEPLQPKNPYTNMPFTRAMLFEIYMAVRRSNYKMPVLLHLFYLAEFNVDIFLYENEAIIRDMYIRDFIKTNSVGDVYPYVKQMILFLDKQRKLRIDRDFPKDRLVEIMRPYLKLYMYYTYSLSHTDKKCEAYFILRQTFSMFIQHNPQFGRRILQPFDRNANSNKYSPVFNDKHLSFNECQQMANANNSRDDEETEDDDDDDEEEERDNTYQNNNDSDSDDDVVIVNNGFNRVDITEEEEKEDEDDDVSDDNTLEDNSVDDNNNNFTHFDSLF